MSQAINSILLLEEIATLKNLILALTWTRIPAFLGHTGLSIRTIIVDLTFRFTLHIRISWIIRWTSTTSHIIYVPTLRIDSTRTRVTNFSFNWLNWGWFWITLTEWVSSIIIRTWTDCIMIYYITFGVDSTGANTGITAFQLNTGLVSWTLRIDHTLWSTVRRGSKVTR